MEQSDSYMTRQDSVILYRERVAVIGMILALAFCFSSMLDVVRDTNLDWTVYKICLAIALAVISFCITVRNWGR
jgi:drug/metabolite transporter superfamily protein YnfA